MTAQEKAVLSKNKEQKFVTSWLSKRYRVAGDAERVADVLHHRLARRGRL